MTPLIKLPDTVVGDRWDLVVGFSDPNLNFSGVTVTAKLRSPNYASPVVYTFTTVTTFADPNDTTTFQTQLTLAGTDTTTLGVGVYVGDIVITTVSVGPYTPVTYIFNLTPRITS